MLNAFIVEDEPLASIRLQKMLGTCIDRITLVGEANQGRLAILAIEKLRPDVLFLDIQLPDMTGFEMLNNLTYQPLIIFTTAYEQYAIQAFDTYSIDYLVKPYRLERFKRAIDKLLKFGKGTSTVNFQKLEQSIQYKDKTIISFSLPIKLGDRILLIDYEDITYLKAEEKYIRVFTNKDKSYLSDGSLSKLENRLPNYFLRVHRSFIINQNYIREVRKFFKGKLILVLNDAKETAITTGETYSGKVRKLLGI
ncbi:MAG: LytR/AlgR family response regulator transcription factor [Saprospiraceae bacterium]